MLRCSCALALAFTFSLTASSEGFRLQRPSRHDAAVGIPQKVGAYDPCAGKVEDEECNVCDPNDGDCMESGVLKTCQSGECKSRHGDGTEEEQQNDDVAEESELSEQESSTDDGSMGDDEDLEAEDEEDDTVEEALDELRRANQSMTLPSFLESGAPARRRRSASTCPSRSGTGCEQFGSCCKSQTKALCKALVKSLGGETEAVKVVKGTATPKFVDMCKPVRKVRTKRNRPVLWSGYKTWIPAEMARLDNNLKGWTKSSKKIHYRAPVDAAIWSVLTTARGVSGRDGPLDGCDQREYPQYAAKFWEAMSIAFVTSVVSTKPDEMVILIAKPKEDLKHFGNSILFRDELNVLNTAIGNSRGRWKPKLIFKSDQGGESVSVFQQIVRQIHYRYDYIRQCPTCYHTCL